MRFGLRRRAFRNSQQLLERRRGFTLIEVLAAFVILALSMAQLLRSIGMGAQNERRADFLLRATSDGESHLAALGSSLPLVIGETVDSYEDGLHWTLNVARDRQVSVAGGAPVATGYRVRLEIHTKSARPQTLVLVAEKIVFPEPASPAP